MDPWDVTLKDMAQLIVPRGCGSDFKCAIFKCVVMINFRGIFSVITWKWVAQDLTSDKSALVQVMAWCRQVHDTIWCH